MVLPQNMQSVRQNIRLIEILFRIRTVWYEEIFGLGCSHEFTTRNSTLDLFGGAEDAATEKRIHQELQQQKHPHRAWTNSKPCSKYARASSKSPRFACGKTKALQ